MTHMMYTGPIIDAHTHIFGNKSGINSVRQTQDQHGYEKTNILAVEPMLGCADNARCLLYKLKYPESFAFVSLNHADGDYKAQAQRLAALGADGFKMIEGKPNVYKQIGKPLNHESYNGFYGYLQAEGYPLLMHVGDPPEFWDVESATPWAIEQGYVYAAEGYPSLEQLYEQVEDIANRFPRLKLILAHFFFMSNTPQRARDFLVKHQNVSFDICPGTEMFINFSKDTQMWKQFFCEFSTRLIFGTDNCCAESLKDADDKLEINRMIHNFLQTDYPFSVWSLEMQGIALSEAELENIYHKNFEKLLKKSCILVDKAAFVAYCKQRAQCMAMLCGSEQDEAELLAIAHEAENINIA